MYQEVYYLPELYKNKGGPGIQENNYTKFCLCVSYFINGDYCVVIFFLIQLLITGDFESRYRVELTETITKVVHLLPLLAG